MRFVKQFLGNGEVNGNGKERAKALFEPNPYLNARRQWNSQIDRAFSAVHVYQLIAVACLLIALACVAGITYIGSKAKFVPYVIQVDRLGETVAVGPAQVAIPADPRVIRASLAAFIANARLVLLIPISSAKRSLARSHCFEEKIQARRNSRSI
jgi:type IV secretory pathway TrbF-like protein